MNNDALNYHAFHWLEYGYLQQGKIAEARKMVEQMKDYCTAVPSSRARSHMIYLATTYAVETNDFTSVAGINFKYDDLNVVTRAGNHFIKGMQAFYQKDGARLDTIINKMTIERLVEKERATAGIGICGNVTSEKPTLLDVQQSEVMELELKAMQARLQNNAAATEQFLKQAVNLESNISYAYGPPTIVKPSFELYGEWLLENGRAKEAITQFEISLKAAPERALSVKGKEKALRLIKS